MPMRRLAFLLVLLALPLAAQNPAPATQRPDLVVVISIDQFRYEYVTRFAPYLSEGGLNRALKNGANFRRALYSYATTYTGPGHAAIGSGYTPSRSGIVGNNWFDRNNAEAEYCVGDARSKGGFSPMNLASDTLGDRVGERFAGSKVIGVALKDRAAILMAGRKATAAYWFEADVPGFTSSSYYRFNKPLLDEFNKTVPALVKAHPEWVQSDFIPAADLAKLTHDPESLRKYKTAREGLGVAFPHPIKSIEALTATPFGNDYVLGFAEKILDAEKLGTEDGTPDILYVGLSSPDYAGHSYGPDSLEAADMVMRTDRQLEQFFKMLDAKFGNRYTVAITADHGVQSIPEVAKDMGRDAGRVLMRNPGAQVRKMGELAAGRKLVEKSMAAKLGVKVTDETETTDDFILYFDEPSLYINWARVRALKLDPERVKKALRDSVKEVKGVRAAWTNTELQSLDRRADGLSGLMAHAFRADRSGDVLVTLKQGWIWGYSDTGTTHGQAVDDDQHVPLLFFGRGITAGTYDDEVAPTYLAKTIGSLFGVDAGGIDTEVLPCVR
ncbi:MAG: alkaline phosphatase family protein [Acidobacteria bacterium]|nr:alkaline phosphatase family protein [Acidobacteriota bacterium]